MLTYYGRDGKPWRCPHCGARAVPTSCKKCDREMCDQCISDDPEVGPVCGLCYDRKHDPEERQ